MFGEYFGYQNPSFLTKKNHLKPIKLKINKW